MDPSDRNRVDEDRRAHAWHSLADLEQAAIPNDSGESGSDGGGTDAPKAISYCSNLVEQPEKTNFVFISDLYTSGEDEMIAGMRESVESKVKVICLLALTDKGKPSCNHQAAKRVAALGIPTLACTPNRLIDFVEAILQGREIDARARARHGGGAAERSPPGRGAERPADKAVGEGGMDSTARPRIVIVPPEPEFALQGGT